MTLPSILANLYVGTNNLAGKVNAALIRTEVDIEDLLTGDGAADGALSGLSDAVDSYGKGAYSIGQKVGIYVVALALVIFFISMVWNGKNAQKSAENKDAAPRIILGVVGLFAVGGLLVFLQKIGGNLF